MSFQRLGELAEPLMEWLQQHHPDSKLIIDMHTTQLVNVAVDIRYVPNTPPTTVNIPPCPHALTPARHCVICPVDDCPVLPKVDDGTQSNTTH